MPNENNTNPEPKDENVKTEEAVTIPTFDEWISSADETVKTIVNNRFTALENTVKATREERDALKAEMKKQLKNASAGSEAEKSLNEALEKLERTERKASFLEEAMKPGIGCRNPKAAYALAIAEDLFTRAGLPDWSAIKESAPELFGSLVPRGNAGSGTNEQTPNNTDMNAVIRKMAGVQ